MEWVSVIYSGLLFFVAVLDGMRRLLRSAFVAPGGNEGEDDVGHPHRQHGRPSGIDGKGAGDGLEHNVGEGQCQSDANGGPFSTLAFLGGEGNSDKCKDECRKR